MPITTTTDTAASPAPADTGAGAIEATTTTAAAPKPPWRFAAERRLGRRARRLLGVAEAELPQALAVVGADAVLAATRCERWALACLERGADCDDGSEAQDAWVLLAACRPTLVRRAIHGEPPNRHVGNRQRPGAAERDRLGEG